MTREPIIAALFAKLAAVPGVMTASRILAHFNDIPAAEQPALFLAPTGQTAQQTRGLPAKWMLDVDCYVYVKRQASEVPDTVLNGVLDGIDAALAPTPGTEVQTLGGLCEHAWIEGTIEIEVGTMGDQVLAIVPLRILATN